MLSKEEYDKKLEDIIKRINDNIKAGKGLRIIKGAFGDIENCEGIVEDVIAPPEGGIYSRLYGCSYLFVGYPDVFVLDMIGIPKAMISEIPRRFIQEWSFKIWVAFMFIFRRKKLYHLLRVWFSQIYTKCVQKVNLHPTKFSRPSRAIRSAVIKNFPKDIDVDLFAADTHLQNPYEFWQMIANATEFILLFIDFDNAYRLRMQDCLGELNKINLVSDPHKEIDRLADILIEREFNNPNTDGPSDMKRKFKFLKTLLIWAMRLDKNLNKLVIGTLLDLNMDMVKLTEDDWYFCLRRQSYNFQGMSFEDRLKEKERIDNEKGHIVLRFTDKPVPPQPTASAQTSALAEPLPQH